MPSLRAARALCTALAFFASAFSGGIAVAAPPNIVFILADDLGIGDVKCFNPEGKIATPNLDALAAQGMRFTDAHTSSSVCSPTRYGLLTGRYNWRSRLQAGVLGGLSPHLIDTARPTVATLLKQKGYATACVGKWHLGMDWELLPGQTVSELNIEKPVQVHSVDFTKPNKNGPLACGFDWYFGISASLDMVPYTFLENDHAVSLPTVEKSFPMVLDKENDQTRSGPGAPEFEAVDVLPTLAAKAAQWIAQRAADAKSGKPFFLYLPLNAPHTPIATEPQFRGKSGLNAYADFVMQTDATIGQVLKALKESGLEENTLVLVTSDNGCSPKADLPVLREKGHDPSAGFRGGKADIYEGGHRVPFLVRWPRAVKAGSVCEGTICLTDFTATAAELAGIALPESAAEDSFSFVAALKGGKPSRPNLVSHSVNGTFAIREGNLKLCLCPGSGGWSEPRPGSAGEKGLPPVQLFDLSVDPAETHNLALERPAEVERLRALLEKLVADGRSTPGPKLKNDVEPELVKVFPNKKNR